MAACSKILLQGGTLLVHEVDERVVARQLDLLIDGNNIVKIEEKIDVNEESVKIINCDGKIVSPGFVSTHHHLWQTQLKGQHGNHTLLEYIPSGNFIGSLYSTEDAFWGELGGAMEAIDAGTTSVVDHSSLNVGDEYPSTLMNALVTSGLRAVYCQCVPRTVLEGSVIARDDYSPTSALRTWKELAKVAPFADGRVQLGFAVDNLYLPTSQLQELYTELRSMNAKIITTHGVGGKAFSDPPSAVQLLNNAGLLGPDILLSHANFPKDGDAGLLAKHGASVSSTPNTELQMGWAPVAFMPEFQRIVSLGVDCHSWGNGFMPGQMRMLLQHARTKHAERLESEGKWSRHVGPLVEEVFNLGTIGGARSMGMAGQIGQIKLGAKADLVIFDTKSPSMWAAAQEDPVSAIVLHSSERDVETVIVDGVVRKEGGKLLPVSIATAPAPAVRFTLGRRQVEWIDVMTEVLESRKRIKAKAQGIDFKLAEEAVIDGFHMDRNTLMEAI
ncbi:Amidohydrolase 1 [Penicillium coprophilum]|uniref:Amidohydrolase 1 n=1 Tax=Penicillium coprophilum TaxID=36646 RepID=UPI00238FC461|nr:Amidohydrolase 1 [Penicillium coprophilum]KAJ5170038.1 Amidohydrolase 1 [Penicillium coprophilum]